MRKKLILGLFCLMSMSICASGDLMLKMGVDYLIQGNYKEALFWLNKAADDGNVEAISTIALCYYNGMGVEQNYEKAIELYERAAAKGDGFSIYMIGVCHFNGQGLKKNTSKGIKYFEQAIDKGYLYAMTVLANCYYNGDGVKCNKQKAIAIWTEAAEKGEATAQLKLSNCYTKGDGVNRDEEKAKYWCKQSAEQGNAKAQYKYANLCIDADNYQEAAIWLLKASEQGHEQAKNQLDVVADLLQDANVYISPQGDTTDVGEILILVDTMPEFPGGLSAMMKYISDNIQYPVIAQENGIEGRVICQFVVEKDGSVTDIKVVRSAGEKSLDMESIRVIKTMPNWTPGYKNGKPVRVKYTLPINFKLESDNAKGKKSKKSK